MSTEIAILIYSVFYRVFLCFKSCVHSMDIISLARNILFCVCPSSRNFPLPGVQLTNLYYSDFHITQEPNPYTHYQMSAVDKTHRQEREV